MILDERDIALGIEHRTRQLRAAGSAIGAVFIVPRLRARLSPDSITFSANLLLVLVYVLMALVTKRNSQGKNANVCIPYGLRRLISPPIARSSLSTRDAFEYSLVYFGIKN